MKNKNLLIVAAIGFGLYMISKKKKEQQAQAAQVLAGSIFHMNGKPGTGNCRIPCRKAPNLQRLRNLTV